MSTNQVKFKNDLKRLFADKHTEMVKMTDQREELRRKVDDGILMPDYAEAEVEAIDRKIEKVRGECEAQAREMIEQRLEELDTADVLRPEQLNDDYELLRFDWLTQKDVNELAERNRENPTMCRLIDRYAAAHNLTVAVPAYVMEQVNSRNEAEAMREVARVALRWLGDQKRGQSVLDRLFAQVGV